MKRITPHKLRLHLHQHHLFRLCLRMFLFLLLLLSLTVCLTAFPRLRKKNTTTTTILQCLRCNCFHNSEMEAQRKTTDRYKHDTFHLSSISGRINRLHLNKFICAHHTRITNDRHLAKWIFTQIFTRSHQLNRNVSIIRRTFTVCVCMCAQHGSKDVLYGILCKFH